MTCGDFIDYVSSLLPNSDMDTQSKASRMLMHMITLMRAFDKLELSKVRSSTGKPFTEQIMHRESLVLKLAGALKLKFESLNKPKSIPEYFQRWASELGVDTAEVQSRHKKLASAVNEICVQALFVRIAQVVMRAMHEDTLRDMDKCYRGHCHPSYVPKTWPFGKEDRSLLGLKTSQLPGARAPHAVAPHSISSLYSAKNLAELTRRGPAAVSDGRPVRRAAHPYARPIPKTRESVSSASCAGVSRSSRRSAQRSVHPTHIPTHIPPHTLAYIPTSYEYGPWHPAHSQRAPYPISAY
ncbi:hypothetical protein BDV93DRAFT_549853 [Ceratobasidium sp. AG-I]|nr:hypothetical protein BDV93DRAFT_549853 [Ceratobasidium sp. AG-I]